jgi:hypothetical protein
VVRLVTHKATGVKYAVKCLDVWMINSVEGLKQLRDEISIMCQVRVCIFCLFCLLAKPVNHNNRDFGSIYGFLVSIYTCVPNALLAFFSSIIQILFALKKSMKVPMKFLLYKNYV